ncbi:MAG: RloB domain-containing protein [Selenomonadaceae bacterium]|nr:RloB domain-containing protein [Selenomonadaceae bacterium]
MSKKDRMGNRKNRDSKMAKRTPDLGYYLIVTDTEATERCYFQGLYNSIPKELQDRLVIRTYESKTKDMINKCKNEMAYSHQYRIPWLVFDRDQVKDFDKKISLAEKEEINVGWSNPCFEIWMYAYWGKMPNMQNSQECCSKFGDIYEKKTGVHYDKADEQLYSRLCKCGDEQRAIVCAEKKMKQCKSEGKNAPSNMCPATTIYKLVKEIREKIEQVNKCD